MSIKLKLNQEYQEIGSKILFTKESLKFFEDLKQNNHTEWFKNNKLRYDEHVKKPLIRFTEILIEEFKKIEPNFQAKPQDCFFRINRDIRFSKNKNPYKEFSGAYFCIAGKGSAGGIYNPSKEVLKTLRYEIAGNLEVFQSIIYNPTFIEYTGGLARVEQNKILDKFLKPFIEKEPSILNKHFYFWKVLPPEILLSEQLICTVQKIWEVSIPFYKFLKDIF